MKKLFWIIFIILVMAAGWYTITKINSRYAVIIPPITSNQPATSSSSPPPHSPTSTTTKSSLLLNVPFTSQAPTGNWDTLHNEDCEEAAAVMANAYYNGPHVTKLDPTYTDNQMSSLNNWELQNLGYDLDINSPEVVKMIEANYNLNASLVTDYDENTIKQALRQNKLVLIPENGQMLYNPNYKQPGPKYHVLVIRGYTISSLITNDPGTRNGMNYSYSFQTLYNANGEWDHQTNSVDLSQKNIIVISIR